MKEPRELLRQILDDPYATDASKRAACKLYNCLRRQVGRRKRARARLEEMERQLNAVGVETIQKSGTG